MFGAATHRSKREALPPNVIQQPKGDLVQGATQDCTYLTLGEDTYLKNNGAIELASLAAVIGMSLTFWRRILQLGAQMSRWRVSSLANCSDWVSRRVCRNLRMRQRSWLGKSWAGLKKQKRTRLVLISTRSPVKQKRTRLVSILRQVTCEAKEDQIGVDLKQVTYEAEEDQIGADLKTSHL
jgi:hypothetical protein